jgi:anti-anti-sigma regulatory factor
MAAIHSIQLSIGLGPSPGNVVINMHGALDVTTAAGLARVCDGLLDDPDTLTISIDFHRVYGLEIEALGDVAAAAERAEQRGVDLTFRDPPELLCQALEEAGLTDRVRMVYQDSRPPWQAIVGDRRRSRRCHPSYQAL